MFLACEVWVTMCHRTTNPGAFLKLLGISENCNKQQESSITHNIEEWINAQVVLLHLPIASCRVVSVVSCQARPGKHETNVHVQCASRKLPAQRFPKAAHPCRVYGATYEHLEKQCHSGCINVELCGLLKWFKFRYCQGVPKLGPESTSVEHMSDQLPEDRQTYLSRCFGISYFCNITGGRQE